jgi:MFS transporter, MFS domain-containing protein family, molybdate-anion transporter
MLVSHGHTLQPFNDYNILLIGRLLGGVATSLLFTVFESWMVCEHLSRGYPSALLSNTFSKLTTGNGLVAVAAGLVANFTTVMFATPLAPFIVACVPLAFVGLLSLSWTENYGDNTVPIGTSMQRAWNYMCSGM